MRLVETRSEGTLFIHSNCNHAVTFTLVSGRVTAVYFGPRKGRKAISLVREITGGRCRFEDSGPGRVPQDLPSTGELMKLLLSDGAAAEGSTVSQPENPTGANAEVWNRALKQLQTVLTDHLGPIAGIILEESLAELDGACVSDDRFYRLIDNLALNIEVDQVALFRDQGSRILSNRS